MIEIKSKLGNLLSQKSKEKGLREMGLIAYDDDQVKDANKYKISLRSIGDEDTTTISQHYNGGGHKNASAFVIDKNLFLNEWKSI